MSKYANQLIIEFLNGSGDSIIAGGSLGLQTKYESQGGSSPIVTVRTVGVTMMNAVQERTKRHLRRELAKLDNESRLYLRGHGDWVQQTLGGWYAAPLAKLLIECGMPHVALVSVTGCRAARSAFREPSFSPDEHAVGHSLDNFVAKLHYHLYAVGGLQVEMNGRVHRVSVVDSAGSDKTGLGVGQKVTQTNLRDRDGPEPSGLATRSETLAQRWSKKLYYWQGTAQTWRWVDDGRQAQRVFLHE